MSWFTYFLRCRDNSIYIGCTNNLPSRVKVHNTGKGSTYVRSRRPATLIYFETFATKSEALKREIHIKKWTKQQKELFLSHTNQIHAPA